MGAIEGKRFLGIMMGDDFYCRNCAKPEEWKEAKKDPDKNIITSHDVKEGELVFSCDRCTRVFDLENCEEEGR